MLEKLVNLINTNCNGTLTEEALKVYLDTLDLKIVSSNDADTEPKKNLSTSYMMAKKAVCLSSKYSIGSYVDDIYQNTINNKKNDVINDVRYLTGLSSIPSEVHEFCSVALDSIN